MHSNEEVGSVGGSCDQCHFRRTGSSIAAQAFEALDPATRPKVQQEQTAALTAEASAAGQLLEWAEAFDLASVEVWGRRPSHPQVTYCGLQEFAAVYFVDKVKNRDGKCEDFKPKQPDYGRRTCATCQHNRVPSTRIRLELQRQLGPAGANVGDQMLQNITAVVDDRAKFEHEECIQTAGHISAKPGFLPYCHVRSTDGRVVVGPVVNAAGTCAEWSEGTSLSDAEATLDQLLQAVRAAETRVDDSRDLLAVRAPTDDALIWGFWLRSHVRRARIAVIDHCLNELQTPPAFIESVRTTVIGSESPFEPDEVIERRFKKACNWFEREFGRPPPGIPAGYGGEVMPAAMAGATGGTSGAFDRSSDPMMIGTPVPHPLDPAIYAVPQPMADDWAARPTVSTAPGAIPTEGAQSHTQTQPQGSRKRGLLRSLLGLEKEQGASLQTPFLVQPNTEYRHPGQPVTVTIRVGQFQTVILVNVGGTPYQFDLWSIPPQTWTPLIGPLGPLPVSVLSQLPQAVYATWM